MKKSKAKVIVIVLIVLIVAAAAIFAVVTFTNRQKQDAKKTVPTEAATEITITPADKEDSELFLKALPGTWSSYTKEGVAYTYTFEENGTVHYKKNGENAVDYTYVLKDDLLTIKGSQKSFVYQLSKDAVGMMANLHYGQIKNLFAKSEETIRDFNGCVYINDDFLYLGTVCMIRDDKVKTDDASLEGDWLGVVGDKLTFNANGSYDYLDNSEKYKGKYTVSEDGKQLTLTLSGNTNDYDDTLWGINGRVLHIKNQYYFKLSEK